MCYYISSFQGLDNGIARDRLRDLEGQIYNLNQPLTHGEQWELCGTGLDLARRSGNGYIEVPVFQYYT